MSEGNSKSFEYSWKVEDRISCAFDRTYFASHDIADLGLKLEQILFGDMLTNLPPTAPPLRERKRYIGALKVIAQLLDKYDFREVAGELIEFGVALSELDHGSVRHQLKPAKISSRPLEPGNVWLLRAQVVIAIDQFVHGGMTARKSCKKVAANYPELRDFLSPGSKNFADVLQKWYSDFREEKISQPSARDAWRLRDLLVKSAADLFASNGEEPTPGKIAEALLATACNLGPRISTREQSKSECDWAGKVRIKPLS